MVNKGNENDAVEKLATLAEALADKRIELEQCREEKFESDDNADSKAAVHEGAYRSRELKAMFPN